jgi:hypothetical protein
MENLIVSKDSLTMKILNDLNINITNQKIKIKNKTTFVADVDQNDEVAYYNELHLVLRFIRNQEANTIEI